MKKDKKPDNVVFNPESQKYDASLKPYGTNIGAPAINPNETSIWKSSSVNKANKILSEQFNNLKSEYEALLNTFKDNDRIYNAKFNFEPVIGETYHLYEKEGKDFLSLLSPNECKFNHIGSYRLTSNQIWEKVN